MFEVRIPRDLWLAHFRNPFMASATQGESYHL